jgi:betaine reductase
LSEEFITATVPALERHPLVSAEEIAGLRPGVAATEIERKLAADEAIPLYHDDRVIGCFARSHPEDASLDAAVLLENLSAKASGVLALRHALATTDGIEAEDVEYLLGCGEEAVGDRYQRGGGNLSKAIGAKAGCVNATGSDIKAFCCGPNHAIVVASAVVHARLFETVAVVAGGSLAKLGMKYEGHLKHGMPALEDVLGAVAVVIGTDDRHSPVVDLGCVGKHDIGAGSSQQAIAEAIVTKPLERVGLRLTDVDYFATELHNPELTVPQGSGNVPRNNYRILAALAARRGEIARDAVETFVRERGMPGYSPTQGHIASAVPFLAHARDQLVAGSSNCVFFYAKGSLFLGRMTELSDGLSFLLRRNPNLEQNGGG